MKRLWGGLTGLVLIASLSPVMADEVGAECPSGENWLECRAAAGDKLAIYRLGRTAYEEARETGDFSEPLRISIGTT